MAPLGAPEYCCLAERGLVRRGSAGCDAGGAPARPKAPARDTVVPPVVPPVGRARDAAGPAGRPRGAAAAGGLPLQRAASDGAALSCEFSGMSVADDNNNNVGSEVEQARCECCGLCEEYTAAYIGRVKGAFCGRWVCGLCAEAVNEERHRMGRATPVAEALQAHVAVCVKFNKVERANPAVHLADAVRQLLKKSLDGSRPRPLRSNSAVGTAFGHISKPTLARSSSCIPAITGD